jgi:DNA polymerase III delta' subunit
MESMWKDITGHDHAIELLKGYSESARVPHAFLFAGISGLGKTRVAKEFFKAVNCLERNAEACDRCRNCLKVMANTHPDLVELNPSSRWIKVDEVRDLLSEIGFKPFESRMKFVIIEPAEHLNRESANALLKTLEEPPQNTVIVLISHRPKLLLPTIVSRCQVIRFSPMEAPGNTQEEGSVPVSPAHDSHVAVSHHDTNAIIKIRSEILGILKGSDPAGLAKRYFDQGEGWDVLPAVLVIVESILRDLMALQHGTDNLVNAELKEFPLRHAIIKDIEEMAGLISAMRRGVNENINLRIAATELFIMLSQLSGS